MWSFNRMRDVLNIECREINWEGPFSWTGYEVHNRLEAMPELEGIYLWTFKYMDGYLVYAAGITNSTKKGLEVIQMSIKRVNTL